MTTWQWCNESACFLPVNSASEIHINANETHATHDQKPTAVFSTWATPISPPWQQAHCRRVLASGRLLEKAHGWMPCSLSPKKLSHAIFELAECSNGNNPQKIRLTYTQTGQLICQIEPRLVSQQPRHAETVEYTHPWPRLKHNQRQLVTLTTLSGAHPIWINDDGIVTESPIATLGGWIVVNHEPSLWLPPKALCLGSITRRQWQKAACQLGIQVMEIPKTIGNLSEMPLMLGNSVRGTWWLKTVNGQLCPPNNHSLISQWQQMLTSV